MTKKCIPVILLTLLLSGCGFARYDMPYDVNFKNGNFDVLTQETHDRVRPFATDLCVVTGDVNLNAVDMSQASAAVLFDLNKKEVKYSKNAHDRLYPASLTKVMTALVALNNCSLDKLLTATDAVLITESGAQLCGLKPGDTMTLEQALHILLLYSANDVAMLIAENIGGTAAAFVDMMNEEAVRLGATNTHFMNPHGLTDENHYTTAYDLYLILNEAIQNEKFVEIINKSSYQTTYYGRDNKAREVSYETTNRFLRDPSTAPENINVIGGKTGTTSAAGHCLMLLSKDTSGNPYISVVLKSEQGDTLYQEMTDLLLEINK